MSGHTPGQWQVGISFDNEWVWPVFRLANLNDPNPDGQEVKANARLIAAAPELYDVVREWLDGKGDLHRLHGVARQLIDRVDGITADGLRGRA